MTKNLIPEIAKMLGVQISEEFKVTDSELTYRFTMKHLESYCEGDSWRLCHPDALVNLIEGRCEVIKLPWCPQCGDKFWTYAGNRFVISWDMWLGTA